MGGTSSKEASVEDAAKKTPLQGKPIQTEDYNAPLPREKLPKALQTLVDDEDTLVDQLYDGTGRMSTDSNVRYAAYANRIRTIMLAAQRYVAYTSDIGESFRPIAHPYIIKGAYGVSIAYLIGDVSYEGRKAYLRQNALMNPGMPGVVTIRATDASGGTSKSGKATSEPTALVEKAIKVPAIEDWKAVVAQRAIFQGLASMILPAFTIHSIVKYTGKYLKSNKNPMIRTWGPVGLGLAAVPALPFLYDHPVETAVEWSFHKAFLALGGPDAVGHSPETGREENLQSKKKNPAKEKEL